MPPTVRNKITQILTRYNTPSMRILLPKTEEISLIKPLRGPVRNWCQQPPLFLLFMGTRPPWLSDYGPI